MTPADLARRLFRDQCNIGPNSSLEAYGETAAVAAMVPLIEALQKAGTRFDHCADMIAENFRVSGNLRAERMIKAQHYALEARAALTPQPEEVA